MSDVKNKIKRLSSLVKIRRIQLDQESQRLALIRQEKLMLESFLKTHQQEYLRGVTLLNKARNSLDRQYLQSLEVGLDMIKGKWQDTLRKIGEISKQEHAQMAQTQIAQKNKRTMEILADKQHEIMLEIEKKKDMKLMDDVANRRFRNSLS